MNKNINRLYAIAGKPTRHIIGLMSGTSLDGLDVALCAVSGSGMNTQVELRQFTTIPYSETTKHEIREVFAKQTIDFAYLCLLNERIGLLHAEYVLDCLRTWNIAPEAVDVIASHGQTVFHLPAILHGIKDYPNATLQIGDGDHIAVKTGITTLSDFRQKHIAAGGEGAPLALYGDYCIFSKKGEDRIMLNMGGIANFTFLPASNDPNGVFVTDTGPGNTLIDAVSRRYFGIDYDKDALLAAAGNIHQPLLDGLKKEPFLSLPIPKTTGPELFNLDWLHHIMEKTMSAGMDKHDLLATVTRFSAETIAEALNKVVARIQHPHIYLSGGGAHNPLLLAWIRELLPPVTIHHTAELGIDGDAKEAVLFAVLANEALCGAPIDFGKERGMPAVTMGKISFPG